MVLWYTKNNLKTLQRSIILYQQQQKNTLRPRLRMKQRNIPLRRKRLPFTPLAIQSNQLKVRWWSANMDLTKPATPAAPSKCPMLVFTSSKKKGVVSLWIDMNWEKWHLNSYRIHEVMMHMYNENSGVVFKYFTRWNKVFSTNLSCNDCNWGNLSQIPFLSHG